MEKKVENRIKVVLAERNRTGRWLAETLEKDVRTVSRWSQNQNQPPLDTLADIAELLGVSVCGLIVDRTKYAHQGQSSSPEPQPPES